MSKIPPLDHKPYGTETSSWQPLVSAMAVLFEQGPNTANAAYGQFEVLERSGHKTRPSLLEVAEKDA